MSQSLYHIGFGAKDLLSKDHGGKGHGGKDHGGKPPTLALLSGDPGRASRIAHDFLDQPRMLSENRGLHSYIARLDDGREILSATSGMGAPSLSIIVNELVQVGIKTILRVGTCGAIQDDILAGSVIVSSAALTRQGAARDIAPPGYPAAADPFVTVAMADAARRLDIDYRVGLTASVDTFYEGQERSASSANPHLLRSLQGMNDEYRRLNILNFEMEAGTLFTMGHVYGFAAGCVCAVVAQRTDDESVNREVKDAAVERAIRVAIEAAKSFA